MVAMLKKMSIFTNGCKNGFTWVQNISGGNVEEHVDFQNVKIDSMGINNFVGAMLMKMAISESKIAFTGVHKLQSNFVWC